MELVYLPFNHYEIPVRKQFIINNMILDIEVLYNDRDIYTFIIYKNDTPIYSGKFVYGRNCVDAVIDGYPITLVPVMLSDIYGETFTNNRVSKNNFDDIRIIYGIV